MTDLDLLPALYTDNDPFVCAWLRKLVSVGAISDGAVLERDIRQVTQRDLDLPPAVRVHAFAGIGVWDYALQLAGWPHDVPVWTGSCPCQPFSTAGRRKGTDDERHLWPEWLRLISECRPSVVFGEQVAGPAGRAWLDTVSADLEALDFAVGAADLCAAGLGAPHLRQRLFFCAVANGQRRQRLGLQLRQRRSQQAVSEAARSGEAGAVDGGDASGVRRDGRRPSQAQLSSGVSSESQRPGDAVDSAELAGATRGWWAGCDWWRGIDGKWRPTQPGLFPLAHGASARVGRLRGYGNAIVPQVGAEFIEVMMEEIIGDETWV